MTMIAFSVPGLIGAAIGLLAALTAYIAVSSALRSSLHAFDPSRSSEERATMERNHSAVRMILLADFPVLGGVGYYVGQLLADR